MCVAGLALNPFCFSYSHRGTEWALPSCGHISRKHPTSPFNSHFCDDTVSSVHTATRSVCSARFNVMACGQDMCVRVSRLAAGYVKRSRRRDPG